MKNKVYLLLGIALGALFLYIATKDLKWNDFEYALENLNAWWVLPMLLGGALFFIMKAVRWKLLLQPVYKASSKEVYSSMMIGSSVGYAISVYLGEIVRTLCFAKQSKIRKSSIFATILLERLFDLFILLLFFGIALIYTAELPFDAVKIGYSFTILGFTLFSLMMFAVFQTNKCLSAVHFLSKWLPHEVQKKFIQHIDNGILGLHSLKSPLLLTQVIVTSLLGWLFMAASNYAAFLVVGIDAPFYAAFLIMGLIVVGLSLPNPPGSIGIVEWCYVMGLKPYGIDTGAAFAAAVVFHILFYASVILVGSLYGRQLHVSLRQAAEEASAVEKSK
jgi:uncharacterized protein (TIRG00374 family)